MEIMWGNTEDYIQSWRAGIRRLPGREPAYGAIGQLRMRAPNAIATSLGLGVCATSAAKVSCTVWRRSQTSSGSDHKIRRHLLRWHVNRGKLRTDAKSCR